MKSKRKERLFVDTSAWIALYDTSDVHHPAAVKFFTPVNLRALHLSPLTTNFVFAETYSYFCRNHAAAIAVGEHLRTSRALECIRIADADEEVAWQIAQKYHDRGFSFVDCLSFAVMTRLGCHQAFAFDRHFAQMGFTIWPGQP
ncbi:MAG: PIN domain-containing protein [Clostridia bacterium]|nr:MAG: PIN domain-containing protein [Clostridia bacterium]